MSKFDNTQKKSSERKVTVQQLEQKAKEIPSGNYKENLEVYKKLLSKKPNNLKYKNKVSFYQKKFDRKNKIESQFSQWNGAHRNLTKAIKSSMKDPSSYKHIETRYSEFSDYLIVVTKFSGTNSFGARVPQTYKAKVSLEGTILNVESLG